MTTLRRRLFTIPAYTALFVVAVVSLPVTLPIAASVDLARRMPWGATRSILFFVWYLVCEVAGILATSALWVRASIGTNVPRDRYLGLHFRLQCWWARSLLRGASTVFGMRVEVEGDDDIGSGPIVLFMRHASVADTVLPAVLLSDRHGLRLRYVMKRDLLWDPCLDIVGNRLPNYFVRRASGEAGQEISEIARLAEDIGPGEGVLIYPEGTRFTQQKRSAILERLEKGNDPLLAARARGLRHLLPPRLGGVLGLLECRPDADVVFCAHVGFDKATRFSEFLDGGLVGAAVRVVFWRVPAADVPLGSEARIEWFFEQWARVDSWIARHREDGSSARWLDSEPKRAGAAAAQRPHEDASAHVAR